MTSRKSPNAPEVELDIYRTEDQKVMDAKNRRRMLANVLHHTESRADLVTLVSIIGLDPELDDLAGDDPERLQRLAAARKEADA